MNRLAITVLLFAACSAKRQAEDYEQKSKAIEARLELNKLEKVLRMLHVEHAQFPAGKVGPIPAEPCCKSPGGRCAPLAPKDVAGTLWEKLEFMPLDQVRFQYSYESDGQKATATATGDFDCDGKAIVYKLDVSAKDGVVTANLVEPTLSAD